MNNLFDKIYKQILLEARLMDQKWVQMNTFSNVEKFYSKEHVDLRIEQRYSDKEIDALQVEILLNRFIRMALRDGIWSKIQKEFQGFTFHATKRNIWISGQLQADSEDGVRRIYIATLLPPDDPQPYKGDYRLDLNA